MEQDRNLVLLSLIHSSENMIKREKHVPEGYTHGTGRILSVLNNVPEMTQTEMAERLNIRPQSLTRILTEIEGKGLIVRKRKEDDRRTVMVSITEEGKTAYREISEKRKKTAEAVFGFLSSDEKDTLERLLTKVIHHRQGEQE